MAAPNEPSPPEPPAGAPTRERPPQSAVVPLNAIAPEDIGTAAAQFDTWLRRLTGDYVTLERLTMVAGAVPVIGNIMALVDVLMNVVSIVDKLIAKKAVDFFDWVSLCIDLIGVIPVPGAAAARMTLRPTLHLLREQFARGLKNLSESVITLLAMNLNDKLVGELDKFLEGALDKLDPLLAEAADVADKLLDALIDVLHRAMGEKPLFDVPVVVAPETKLHDSTVTSTLARMLAAGARLQLRAVNALASRGARLLPQEVKEQVLRAAGALGDVKLQFRANLKRLADEKVEQSLRHLLVYGLKDVLGRVKKRSAIAGSKGAKVTQQEPGHGLEEVQHEAHAKADPSVCKLGAAPGSTGCSISFATGAESFTHTDVVLAAPLPIVWARTYRSHATAFDQGTLGARWLSAFGSRIDVLGQGRQRSLVHHGADGRPHAYPWLDVGQSHRDDVESVTLTCIAEGWLQLDFSKPLAVEPVPEPSPWREMYELVPTAAHKRPSQGEHHFRLASQHGLDGLGIGLRYDHAVAGEAVLSDILSKQGDTVFAHLGIQPDAQGRIASLWALKDGQLQRQLAAYTYDEHGDLVQAQDENGACWQYRYRNHLVTRYTDRTGRGNNLQYDHYGEGEGLPKAIREWADDGSADTRLEWDRHIRLTYLTDALGGETWLYYDIAGYTYRVVHPDHLEEWFFRDAAKNVTRHLHADGTTDGYTYDPFGNLVRHVRADGSEVHFEYDRGHRLTGILDPDGGRWLRDYDNHGRLIAETDPLGHKTEYTYDQAGRPIEVKDAKGGKKQLAYDAQGQLARYTDCSGRTTTWVHDTRGRIAKRIDAIGQTTRYRYAPVTQATLDAAGRRETRYDPLNSFPGQLEAIVLPDETTEHLAHDAEGRLLEHSDALGRRTAYRYDAAGRIAERIDAEGHRLGYQWDALGRLATLRNENGQPYTFEYDAVGRLLRETGFDGQATRYRYAATSGVLTDVVEGLVMTRLAFDAMGRLIRRQAERGRDEQTETFAYYPGGSLGEASNENARLQFFYDDAGNLTREHHEYLALQKTAVWHHRYDELNQRIGSTRPDGHTTEWLTYGSGHVHGLLLDGEDVVGFERDALHREVHRAQRNGVTQTQRFDPLGRLRQQMLTHPSLGKKRDEDWWPSLTTTASLAARPAIRRDYRYDASGQLELISDSRRGSLRYRYDRIGRLLESSGGLSGDRETFAFDPAGNIVTPPPEPARRIDRPPLPKLLDNLLKDYAGTSYTWDERGNLTQRKRNGWATDFEWDGFNRMTRAKSVEMTARFVYDPLGRRIGKWSERRSVDRSGAITSTVTETLYGWDGDTIAFESNGGNEHNGHRGESVHYVHEAGSFVPLLQARSAHPIALSPSTDRAALKATNFGEYEVTKDPLWNGELDPEAQHFAPFDIAFYQCDHLGTPVEMTDHEGRIVWEANYKAWGLAKEAISEAGKRAGLKNPIRFQGQYFDEETGLHYNRYRYYDPQAGRYISRDPIGLEGSLNAFAYAANPNQWIDALGLARSGTATACRYKTDTRSGHYTVIVQTDQTKLHTHQVITNDERDTSVVNEDRKKLFSGQTPSSTVTIPLHDAETAQQYQKRQLGKSLGKYDAKTNSCVDHVANVLRAGGEDVPTGAGPQILYMSRSGIKIKD